MKLAGCFICFLSMQEDDFTNYASGYIKKRATLRWLTYQRHKSPADGKSLERYMLAFVSYKMLCTDKPGLVKNVVHQQRQFTNLNHRIVGLHLPN